VCAAIVERAHHNIYSSATNYTFDKGLVPVETANNTVIDVLGNNEFGNIIIIMNEFFIMGANPGDFARRGLCMFLPC